MSATYDHLVSWCGPVPDPGVLVSNPKYHAWIDGAAWLLCDDAGCETTLFPCADHLREARRIAREAGA